MVLVRKVYFPLFMEIRWTQVKQFRNSISYCKQQDLNSGAPDSLHWNMSLFLSWVFSHTNYLISGSLLTGFSFIQAFYLILYDWLMVFVLLLLITCQQHPVTQRENSAWLKPISWETFSSLSSFIYSLKNTTPVTVVHSLTRSYIQLLGGSDLFFHSHFFEPQLSWDHTIAACIKFFSVYFHF